MRPSRMKRYFFFSSLFPYSLLRRNGGIGSANKFRAIEAVRSDFYAGELEVSELKEEDMPVCLMVKFRVT